MGPKRREMADHGEMNKNDRPPHFDAPEGPKK
jgi:hypothetical protein